MIFVTTGTQEPFDRLLNIVEIFAKTIDTKIIIQAKTSKKFPSNVEVYEFLSPIEFDNFFVKSDFIVSHAGMGTIISALYKSRPLVIFPRIASLGEHRNEHQMATAKKIKQQGFVHVVFSDEELLLLMKNLVLTENLTPLHKIGQFASTSLLDSLNDFITKI